MDIFNPEIVIHYEIWCFHSNITQLPYDNVPVDQEYQAVLQDQLHQEDPVKIIYIGRYHMIVM